MKEFAGVVSSVKKGVGKKTREKYYSLREYVMIENEAVETECFVFLAEL